MKKVACAAMALMMMTGMLVAETTAPPCGGTAATPTATAAPGATCETDTMAGNIGRGFANLLTCWLEVPRSLWLEGSRNPYYGWIVGGMNGSFLAVARAFGGATDVSTMGLTGPGIYGDSFPECITQSRWKADDALIYRPVEK
jgi:hypothetical protein